MITDIGIYGLMGLGFDSPLLSPINDKITTLYGSEQSWAASVLANIFLQIPSAPNIVALELQRTGDLEDTDGGTFTIGEVELEFVAVQNSPQLNQYPPGNGRWTTLLDGMKVDGKDVSITSSMKDVPSGKSVTLLDTGNPSLQITKEMRDAIFSGISGAAIDPSGTWIVPCEITTIVEFLFRYVDDCSSPFLN
jgi:saccharopepsin